MAKSRQGALRKAINKEWGRTARKQEAEIRNLNKSAAAEAIAEQVQDLDEGTGAERYFATRMANPKFRKAYKKAKKSLRD